MSDATSHNAVPDPADAAQPQGICPLCEGHGQPHVPCEEPVCVRKGYHRLRAEELQAARTSRRHLDPLIGRRVGAWLVLGELGSGAFGTVFVAQRSDGARAALKVLARPADDPHENASALKKFQLETDALAALAHPGIVGLLDAGVFEDRPWLAMELVEGGQTLKKAMESARQDGKGVPRAFALQALEQVLDALHAAHTSPQRIVHRDVKPENLMLTSDGRLKVLDFGLAKFTESGTETSHALGTPAYMAPEQLWKRRIGPWTDLYAVGVMAFELLTGRRPFSGTAEEVVQKKSSALYDVLTEAEGLPLSDDAARLFRKALAFETEQRFAEAPQLAAALRALPEFAVVTAAGAGRSQEQQAVDLDTEKQRLERMQQQMEQERRRLEEERRRLDLERSQMSASLPPNFAPPTLTPQPPAGGGSGGGGKGGLFLGLAGGVLLVGLLLLFGRAWLTGARDEEEAKQNGAADAVAGAAPAGLAPEADAAAATGVDTQVAAEPAAADAVAAAAADPDAAAATEPDATAAAAAGADAAVAAADDASAAPTADAVAAAGADGAIAVQATAGADAPAGEIKATAEVKADVKAEAETKPADKPTDPKVLAKRRAAEAKRKAEAEARAKEAARQAAIAEEFKRVQQRREAEAAAKKRAEAEKQRKILEEFKKSQQR